MNSIASKVKKDIKREQQMEMSVEPMASDRSVLDTLYNHYGKPKNIVKEKVKLYKHYVSPAGHASPDWIVDGWQQGRVTIFTGHKEHEDDLFYKTKIGDEGVGTWFIAIKGDKLKVSIGGKVDIILQIGE